MGGVCTIGTSKNKTKPCLSKKIAHLKTRFVSRHHRPAKSEPFPVMLFNFAVAGTPKQVGGSRLQEEKDVNLVVHGPL